MAWAKLDDGLTFHEKIVEAGNAATGVWVRGLAWSAYHLTDGFVPTKIARLVAGESRGALKALTGSRLWVECPGGYQIHDYLKYNPSKAEVLEKREKDRLRKLSLSGNPPTGVATASNPPDPDPVPVPLDIEIPGLDDNAKLEIGSLEQFGFKRYGALAGPSVIKVSRLCPIYGWELRHAMTTQGSSWGYFAKVVESIRREAAKPKPPPGKSKRPAVRAIEPLGPDGLPKSVSGGGKS